MKEDRGDLIFFSFFSEKLKLGVLIICLEKHISHQGVMMWSPCRNLAV